MGERKQSRPGFPLLRKRGARARALAALAALAVVALFAGCGSSSSSTSASNASASSASGASSTTSTGTGTTASCAPKPGGKATGTPINLGAIATKEPGSDFSDVPNMVAAYFDCVNANGGINGHPVKMFIEFDQGQPAQIAADAAQLIQTDHVVGIVGAFDLLECTINADYWKKEGIFELDAGIAPGCWSTPNSASVNMGPRFTSDGAVQYALAQHPSKIVFVEANIPVAGYMAAGPAALAKAAGVPITTQIVHSPVQDPNSVALNAVNAAGPNGWVDLAFTPPDALPILQAAQKLGLEDRVKGWGCSSTCNTDFLAKALGPKWNHKLFVNAELADPDDHNGPDMQLYKAIFSKYGHNVSGGIGSFSEFGFLEAKIAAAALATVNGPYTIASVSQAFKQIKDVKSDLLCQPWVYGNYPLHIPNNSDFTTTPDNGKMVTAQGCTPISSQDPQIAAYRKVAGTAPSTNPGS